MVNFVSAVAGIIAAFFSAMVYILMTRKTAIVLTFSNDKDTIEYKAGVNYAMSFSLRNVGRTNAHNVEAVVYFPDNLRPRSRDNSHPEKIEYCPDPERVVLRVDNLPPESNPVGRHISIVDFPAEPRRYEFRYQILGDKVRKCEGRLVVQTRSQG